MSWLYRRSQSRKAKDWTIDRKCECLLGHNVTSNMNSGYPAAYRKSLVTVEPQRADKSQNSKLQDKNTSRLDCVRMQYFNSSIHWLYGVLVNWINNGLIPKHHCKRQKAKFCVYRLPHKILRHTHTKTHAEHIFWLLVLSCHTVKEHMYCV